MSNGDSVEHIDDHLIQQLRDAREAPAVLKSKLAALRSVSPEICVFAFEGIDDKVIYFHWVKQLAPEFSYEPFICKNKGKVLQLKKMLERDLGDLARNVYFFIDRDFDDLQGESQSEALFMTDRYSVENYLVEPTVLEELLKNEFHCHAEPACREDVIRLFQRQYSDFLEITRDLNFRIFVARKCSIKQLEELPRKINQLATVSLAAIEPGVKPLTEQVILEREPTAEEIRDLVDCFSKLNPHLRYRGKFAMFFFRRWLGELATERNHASSKLFSGLEKEGFVAPGHVTLDSMAARASPPAGLKEFIHRIITPEADMRAAESPLKLI